MSQFYHFSLLLLTIVAADTSPHISQRQLLRDIDPNNDPRNIPAWIEASIWPQNYAFDNPMIESLTGNEEPLKTYRMMPYKLQFIGTRFQLFATWATTPQKYLFEMSYNNQSSLDAFPSRKCPKLYLFIHGWNANITESNGDLKSVMRSILDNEQNACLIGVDWSRGASPTTLHAVVLSAEHKRLYRDQAVNTIVVGRQTAFLLYLLVTQRKINAHNIHVMGHSLGGRTTHFVGTYYTRLIQRLLSNGASKQQAKPGNLPEKLGRITGLDIAAPLFDDIPGGILNKGDAIFIDVIHTTGGDPDRPFGITNVIQPGSRFPVGDVDFYPNDAQAGQPDCTGYLSNTPVNPVCSHSKSIDYMADSFNKSLPRSKFRSVYCESYAMLDQCMKQASPSSFGSMGRDAPKAKGRGIQFLRYSGKIHSPPTAE